MLAGTISLTYFLMSFTVGSGLLIIPVMADYFDVSVLAVQWVTSAYQLAYVSAACGLLVSGRLADLYGRKKLYLIGMVVGVISNIVSALIPNRIGLRVFRAVSGLGLSISAPAGFGIIGTTFRTEPWRTTAFAALGMRWVALPSPLHPSLSTPPSPFPFPLQVPPFHPFPFPFHPPSPPFPPPPSSPSFPPPFPFLPLLAPPQFVRTLLTFTPSPSHPPLCSLFTLLSSLSPHSYAVLSRPVRLCDRWQYLYFLLAGFGVIPIITGFFFIPKDDNHFPTLNARTRIEDGKHVDQGPRGTQSIVKYDQARATPQESEQVQSQEKEQDRRIDWIGAVLVTIGLSLLLFSITQAGLMEKGWTTPYIPPIFSASIILILIFGWWEYELENRRRISTLSGMASQSLSMSDLGFKSAFRTNDIPPIVRLSIFTRHKGKISAILGIAFFDWMGVCGWVYLTSVYYQDLLGFSPLKNALHILPAPITGIICSYLVTLVVPRVSAPILLALGGISTGLANALFAFQTPGSIMISNLVDDDEQSIAGALFQVSLQIAGSLDPCISSIILTQIESVHGLLRGLQIALWFNAACCWAVLLIIFFAFRKVRLAKDVAKTI
ncbi:uncharacterized protein I303_103997 [Kwoniella dejecticola CBS 10117]|uniref:Major facilitator superfamily (MFS) profile domain-containing protein n=1 Tax=Kwoniella dejecticola CBS 10117 TaxID=1296121 RepID=A0AAJ8MGY9_9TREE